MLEIDYGSSVFYYGDGVHQVRRHYTIEYLFDCDNIELQTKYEREMHCILESFNVAMTQECQWGKELLESIGVLIQNTEVVPYTLYYDSDCDVDLVESEIIKKGLECLYKIKPIIAHIDNHLLMDKECHGELSLGGCGKRLISITEDVIKPSDISDTASFMMDQLLGLESTGKTIIITDNYLFPQNYDFTYENDLKKVLCFLKAKEIRYYGNQNLLNNNFFQKIKQILKSVGTEITFYNISDFHDRFWINKDTLDGLVFGTSLNGIGRKLCYFDAITRDDAKTIIQYLEK